MAKKKIRPFHFSKLKKISTQFLSLNQALLEACPQFCGEDGFGESFIKEFDQGLGLGASLKFVGYDETPLKGFLDQVASPCLGWVLQVEPQQQKILVELDYSLGRRWVDKLLGGPGKAPKEFLPLSPMEEGVMEFLVARALHLFKTHLTISGPTHIRLIKSVQEAKLMGDLSHAEELGIIFKFFLGLGDQGGYLKVYFPHPLVEGVLLREDLVAGLSSPGEEARIEQGLNRASHIGASLWSEIGRATLQSSERDQLEAGDVILFDETLGGMGPHGVTGKTILRVGERYPEGLLAEVIDSEGKLVVKVLDYYGGQV